MPASVGTPGRARTRMSGRYYYYSMHEKLGMRISSNDAVKHIYSALLP